MVRFNNLTPTQEKDRTEIHARQCFRHFVKKMHLHEQTFDQIVAMVGFNPDNAKKQTIQDLDKAIHKMTTFLGIRQFGK